METNLLIGAIVRQTMALIAKLSTVTRLRAPVAPAPDAVSLRLGSAVAGQGAGQRVAADTVGFAPRRFQDRAQRLPEVRNRRLWSALLELIDNEHSVSRADVQRRFRTEGDLALSSGLEDLVGSGLVTMTGSGLAARYSLTSPERRARLLADVDHDTLLDIACVAICCGATTEDEVAQCLRTGRDEALSVIGELVANGRIEQS